MNKLNTNKSSPFGIVPSLRMRIHALTIASQHESANKSKGDSFYGPVAQFGRGVRFRPVAFKVRVLAGLPNSSLSPTVETIGLSPIQCQFKSDREYHGGLIELVRCLIANQRRRKVQRFKSFILRQMEGFAMWIATSLENWNDAVTGRGSTPQPSAIGAVTETAKVSGCNPEVPYKGGGSNPPCSTILSFK